VQVVASSNLAAPTRDSKGFRQEALFCFWNLRAHNTRSVFLDRGAWDD
jgi:hypothetical protein